MDERYFLLKWRPDQVEILNDVISGVLNTKTTVSVHQDMKIQAKVYDPSLNMKMPNSKNEILWTLSVSLTDDDIIITFRARLPGLLTKKLTSEIINEYLYEDSVKESSMLTGETKLKIKEFEPQVDPNFPTKYIPDMYTQTKQLSAIIEGQEWKITFNKEAGKLRWMKAEEYNSMLNKYKLEGMEGKRKGHPQKHQQELNPTPMDKQFNEWVQNRLHMETEMNEIQKERLAIERERLVQEREETRRSKQKRGGKRREYRSDYREGDLDSDEFDYTSETSNNQKKPLSNHSPEHRDRTKNYDKGEPEKFPNPKPTETKSGLNNFHTRTFQSSTQSLNKGFNRSIHQQEIFNRYPGEQHKAQNEVYELIPGGEKIQEILNNQNNKKPFIQNPNQKPFPSNSHQAIKPVQQPSDTHHPNNSTIIDLTKAHDELKNKNKSLNNEIQTLKETITQLKDEKTKLATSGDNQKKRADALAEDISHLRISNTRMDSEISELKFRFSAASEEARKNEQYLTEQHKATKIELSRMKDKEQSQWELATNASRKMGQLESEKEELKDQILDQLNEIADLKETVQNRILFAEEITKDNDEKTQKIEKLYNELDAMNKLLKEQTDVREDMEVQRNKRMEEIKDLKEDLMAITLQRDETEKLKEMQEAKLEKHYEEKALLAKTVEHLNKSLTNATNAHAALEDENRLLKTQIEEHIDRNSTHLTSTIVDNIKRTAEETTISPPLQKQHEQRPSEEKQYRAAHELEHISDIDQSATNTTSDSDHTTIYENQEVQGATADSQVIRRSQRIKKKSDFLSNFYL